MTDWGVRLLLVTPSGSYRTGDFLAAARSMGCEVVVATDADSAIPGASVGVAFEDPEAAATRLIEVVGEVDGVVGTDGAAVAIAAAVARLLGRPTNSADSLVAAGDKLRQRRGAETAGVQQPRFALVEADTSPSWSVYPAVVKPLDRSASQGVVGVDMAAELTAAVHVVRSIVGAGAPLLVEAFVPGVEVAVEGLLRAGRVDVLAVFDKPDTPQGPTFPETLLVSPARIAPVVVDRLVDALERVVAAIGLREGPVHAEFKVDGGEVWVLELAARTIGGLCSRALHHGGLSLEELVTRHALDLSFPTPAADDDGAATGVLMLPVAATGRVAAIRGLDEARSVEGVTSVVLVVGVGERVVALPAGDRYLGFVFAGADTADAVEAALRAAWAAIHVEIGAEIGAEIGGAISAS